MQPIAIVLAIFAFIVGAYLFRLAQKTPKDEMVPWGLMAKRSHELTYLQAISAWVVSVLLMLVGILL